MNVMGLSGMCMVCRQPNGMRKQKLLRIEELCKDASENTHGERPQFKWGLRSHCKYKLSCDKLDQYDNECKLIASRIEKRIVDAALGDENTYRDLLSLCGGEFSQVYSTLVRIRDKHKNDD